jgi:hypothetical protein
MMTQSLDGGFGQPFPDQPAGEGHAPGNAGT